MLHVTRGGLARLGLALVPAVALAFGSLCAPAAAASNTASVSVAVTAGVQATIGVTYSSGTNISCNVGVAITGFIACTNTATLAGTFRSSKTDSGGTSVSIASAAITGSGGGVIPSTAWEMTCTGGVTGSPTNPGTAGTLASTAALSTSATACQSWTGEIVANYSLVVALLLDASQVPADTYAATNFTATATAN